MILVFENWVWYDKFREDEVIPWYRISPKFKYLLKSEEVCQWIPREVWVIELQFGDESYST